MLQHLSQSELSDPEIALLADLLRKPDVRRRVDDLLSPIVDSPAEEPRLFWDVPEHTGVEERPDVALSNDGSHSPVHSTSRNIAVESESEESVEDPNSITRPLPPERNTPQPFSTGHNAFTQPPAQVGMDPRIDFNRDLPTPYRFSAGHRTFTAPPSQLHMMDNSVPETGRHQRHRNFDGGNSTVILS